MKFQLAAAVAAALVLQTDAIDGFYPPLLFFQQFNHANDIFQANKIAQFYNDGIPAMNATRIEFQQTVDKTIWYLGALLEVQGLFMFDMYDPVRCSTELAITYKKVDEKTVASIDLYNVAQIHPCFQQDSTVVFGLKMSTSEGVASPPILLPAKYRVNVAPSTHGILTVQANYYQSMSSFRSYRGFLSKDFDITSSFDTPTIECPLPSIEEQSTYEEVPVAVSGIGYRYFGYDQFINSPSAIQIRVVSNRTGCSLESPLNVFGFDDSSETTLAMKDCYGYAYATYIKQNAPNGPFVCGSRIPVKIPLNPEAVNSKVYLRSSHHSGVKDYELSQH